MESFLYDTFYEEVSGNKTKAKYKKTRRPGECKVCGKSFNDKNAVYVHMRIHTGEKPYVCEECGKGFNQNSNLKRHLKYHRGERPYHCDVCNKDISCSSRPHFLEHVRAHEGIKPYACNLCSNTYSFKASLINHMKSHEKTHFFVCDICHAGFIYEGQLNNHMRSTHDADYVANKCIICKEVFPATYKLSDHLAKSHDIFTAYECKVCQKRYYNQQALRLHYEEHLEVPSSASKRRKKKTIDVPEEENSNISNVSENQNEDISNVTEVKCENETEDKDITDIPVSTSCVKEVITPEQLEILLRRGTVSHEGRSDYYEVDINSENVYIIENEDASNITESNARVIPSSHYTSGSQVEEVITPDYPELILGHGTTVNPRFVCGICEKEFGSESEINKHFETHEKSKNVPIIQNEAISNVTEDKAKNIDVVSSDTNVKTVITQKDLELLHSHGPVNHRFLCGVCGEEFGSEAEVNKHLETHAKSKNVPTIKNEDVSNVTENKAKDIDNVVPSDTNVKTVITQKDLQRLLSQGPVNHRFLCAVCGKDFSSKTEIDKHLKTHTKVEKLFICGICKDRFSSGDELKSHITNTHDI